MEPERIEGSIVFGDRLVCYRLVKGARTPLRVPAAHDGADLDRLVGIELGWRFWWALDVLPWPPRRSHVIDVNGMRLPVLAFGCELDRRQRRMVSEAVSIFAGTVRRRRVLRRLTAIAVVGGMSRLPQGFRPDRGVPLSCYGTAFVDLRDLTDEDGYHRTLKIPYGTGAVLHELAHAALEPDLAEAWREREVRLGWRAAPPGMALRLQDGSLTERYNERPWDVPTDAAARSEYDDRADSAVFALAGGSEQLGARADAVATVLRSRPTRADLEIAAAEPRLPEVPRFVNVALSPRSRLDGRALSLKVRGYNDYVRQNKIVTCGMAVRSR